MKMRLSIVILMVVFVSTIDVRVGFAEEELREELDILLVDIDRVEEEKISIEQTYSRRLLEVRDKDVELKEKEDSVGRIRRNIGYLEGQVVQVEELIRKGEVEFDNLYRDRIVAEEDLAEAQDELSDRIRSIRRGSGSVWLSVLVRAESIVDVVQTVFHYRAVVSSDREVMSRIEERRERLEGLLKEEEDRLDDMEMWVGRLKGYEKELGEEEERYRQEMERVEEELVLLNVDVSDLEEDKESVKKRLVKLREEEVILREKISEVRLKVEKERIRESVRESVSGEEEEKEDEGTILGEYTDVSGEKEIMGIVREVNKNYGLPEEVVYGLIRLESGFNVRGYNDANRNGTVDRGVMQINNNTAPWLAGRLGYTYEVGLEYDPRVNIEMGLLYLNDQYKRGKGVHYALTAYNRGPGGANTLYQRQGNYESSYSRRVLDFADGYR